MDDLSQLTTETLYTYMRNALATGSGCIGHTKAHMNSVKANAYRDELNKRGEKLPAFDLNTLFPEKEDWADWRSFQRDHGTYNGPGSF
jgi:hypothetical protein